MPANIVLLGNKVFFFQVETVVMELEVAVSELSEESTAKDDAEV